MDVPQYHFYPRSPCGERQQSASYNAYLADFYPRSPCGERQSTFINCNSNFTHFYPRSPCGERQAKKYSGLSFARISIHALLAESDIGLTYDGLIASAFLSTLSLRRATENQPPCARPTTYFYPRSPCGERRSSVKWQFMRYIFLSTLSLRRATLAYSRLFVWIAISIHALLAESDPKGSVHDFKLEEFLSTLSLRRATVSKRATPARHHYFYPRSPCGERLIEFRELLHPSYFYPRSPCGERRDPGANSRKGQQISIHALLAESDLGNAAVELPTWKFLSTLSLRRATINRDIAHRKRQKFLSTLSLRRATNPVFAVTSEVSDFYPRSPCGERRAESRQKARRNSISIHALLAESDGNTSFIQIKDTPNFYPRSPCGERLENALRQIVDRRISIHALLAESD